MLANLKTLQGRARHSMLALFIILISLFCICIGPCPVFAAGPIKVSYYYEEVCASCDGTKEFFELYNRVISSEDKKHFQAEIATYNVFMDSCRVQYENVKKELEIPSGTGLPVIVIEDQWISGHDNMEAQMREILLAAKPSEDEDEKPEVGNTETGNTEIVNAENATEKTDHTELPVSEESGQTDINPEFLDSLQAEVQSSKLPVAVLFSTNGCEDCNFVKEWFSDHELSLQILEYNIIEDECLGELKGLFRQYQVPEDKQKVPAVFFGDQYLIGKDEIPQIEQFQLEKRSSNKVLTAKINAANDAQSGNDDSEEMNLLTLGAAGLLAGFNPCSISMLLMLLSLLLSEKASIWKSGLLYLIGKYVAYCSIGMVIFVTASQISNQTMETIGTVMNVVMGILFAAAAVFYIADAVRIFRQDYGHIKTQLPVGLRRMNHNLIKKVSSAGGIMQPLMILILGIVISFGEFFCTGQIYMASITYMLKDQMKAAILPFLVYTTAMSVPAVIMILLIQRTRNTDAVSDFMFRHLGLIKIFNAILFTLFAVYFLVF